MNKDRLVFFCFIVAILFVIAVWTVNIADKTNYTEKLKYCSEIAKFTDTQFAVSGCQSLMWREIR